MGKQIVYCGGCGRSLYEDDFAKGRAHTVDNRPFCGACRPVPVPPSPSATPKAIPRASESSSGKFAPARKTSSGHIPVVPAPSTTRRMHASPAPHPGSKAPLVVGGVLAGIGLVVLVIFMSGGNAPEAPPAAKVDPPAPAPAPSTVPAAPAPGPKAAAPRPAPAAILDASAAVKELETLGSSSADPDAVLQRCEELRSTLRGTPHEAALRAVQERAQERKKARDRDRQVTASIEQARQIMGTAHLADRKEEVFSLLKAAREISGTRREEVDSVIAEVEKRLKEPPPASAPPPAAAPASVAVLNLTLLNADTDKPISGFDPIGAGAVINLATLGTRHLNIRANTAPDTVGSVRFVLNGVPFRVEDQGPYSLAGNTAGDYWPWTPAPGKYTLTASPHVSAKAAGVSGTPSTVTFEVVDPSASSGRLTVSFQDGVSPTAGYDDSRDTQIVELNADKNNGSNGEARVMGDQPAGQKKQRTALLWWDLTSLPAGSVLHSVSLSLVSIQGSSDPCDLYEAKRPWTEKQATWNESAKGKPWEVPGARGPLDRGSTSLGQVQFKATGGLGTFELNAAGVAVVQSWIENPAANQGFIIAGNKGDDLDFATREAPAVANRPRLTIVCSKGTGAAPRPVPAAGSHELEATGLITRWLVVGPFGNRKDPWAMWDHDLLRKEDEYVPAPGLEVTTREGARVRWAPASAPDGDLAFHKVDHLGLAGRTQEPAIAFAACWLEVASDVDVKFRVNADHSYRFWLDHKVVGARNNFPLSGDPETHTAHLARGAHLMLIKAGSTGGSFGLRVRVTTKTEMRNRAPGIKVSTSPPGGTTTVTAPARRVTTSENFDKGPGKFKGGTVVEGGVDGSKALAVTKCVDYEGAFASPVTPSLSVRFKVKPLFDVQGFMTVFWVKDKGNHWYHIKGVKKEEWKVVEFKLAEARLGYRMDGASLLGELPANFRIAFEHQLAAGTVLIDDFEMFEETK